MHSTRISSLRSSLRAAALAACLFAAGDTLQAQVVTLSDTEFVPADWSVATLLTSGSGGSVLTAQVPSGGNPDAYRQVVQTVFTGAGSYVGNAHELVSQQYTASTNGAILSVDFFVDARQSNPPFTGAAGQSIKPILRQAGVLYLSNSGEQLSPEPTWTPKAFTGLTAADFVELGGFANPDFSATAPSLTVGFLTANSTISSTYTTEVGYDNFRVELTTTGITPYCTAGTSASGCQAALTASGFSSTSAASGFTLTATNVEGSKFGRFFFGSNGRQANAWGNGTSYQCVVPPVTGGGVLVGVGTAGSCDGTFTQDLNALWSAKPAKNPGSGAVVQAQLWYRDPFNTSNQTTSLSNAVEFTVLP